MARPTPLPVRTGILSVGRLVPRKGVDLVIRALPYLLKAGFDDVELLIVGGGADAGGQEPEARRLLDLARDLGVAGHVELRGQVPQGGDARNFQKCGCRGLHSLVRALRHCSPGGHGLRCPGGRRCGGRTHGQRGGPRNRPARPAKGPRSHCGALVGTLLDSPDVRAKLGRAGERRAKARYSWNRVAAETEKAYQLAIAGTAEAGSLEPMEGAAL